MKLPLNEKTEKALILRKRVEASPVPTTHQEQQDKATYNLLTRLWYAIRGHTASDIKRLKEAGVGIVESERDMKDAEAHKRFAEAERAFAEAEKLRQEASLTEAEAEKTRAEADAIRMQAVTDAMIRLNESTSRIRQEGGDTIFDLDQIQQGILKGYNLFPDDPDIADTARQIRGSDDEGET